MSVGSSPLSYLTHKRKDLLPPGQALLTGAKGTTRKHSGLELAADWLSSSSCLLYLLTALDSWVLLTYFTLRDIHTALGINSALRLSSTQAPAVLLHLHTALVWIMPLLRTSVPSYARIWPEPHFRLDIYRSCRTIHSLPKHHLPDEVWRGSQRAKGMVATLGHVLDIETNTTEETALMYYQGEKFQ